MKRRNWKACKDKALAKFKEELEKQAINKGDIVNVLW